MLHLGPEPQQYETRIPLSSNEYEADLQILFEKTLNMKQLYLVPKRLMYIRSALHSGPGVLFQGNLGRSLESTLYEEGMQEQIRVNLKKNFFTWLEQLFYQDVCQIMSLLSSKPSDASPSHSE